MNKKKKEKNIYIFDEVRWHTHSQKNRGKRVKKEKKKRKTKNNRKDVMRIRLPPDAPITELSQSSRSKERDNWEHFGK